MLTSAIYAYDSLSIKGRLILSVLVTGYELNANAGFTRKEIAESLDQARLYPHDDRAIKRLERVGFIRVAVLRKGFADGPQWDRQLFTRQSSISSYTRYHVHSIDTSHYETLVKLLQADGLYRKAELGPVGGAIKAIAGLWSRVQDWL